MEHEIHEVDCGKQKEKYKENSIAGRHAGNILFQFCKQAAPGCGVGLSELSAPGTLLYLSKRLKSCTAERAVQYCVIKPADTLVCIDIPYC